MRYLDVCSGISAPTMAWKPLGWEAACFAEIEAAPRAVLAHHYPDVPLRGDFTEIEGIEYGPIDLLVGGTPCQPFSIAGLRGGLGDDRGNLALEFARLADRARPRWLVWENVPGVLSIDEGRAFGSILGAMAELGYGTAYRVLDAQYFNLAQRRRRVFVIGYLGDWRPPAAVLFERQSMSGDPAPSRKGRSAAAGTLSAGAHPGGMNGQDAYNGLLIPYYVMPMNSARYFVARPVDVAQPVMAGGPVGGNQGGDFIAYRHSGNAGAWETGDRTDALTSANDAAGQHLIAFAQNQRDEIRMMDVAGACAAEPGMKQTTYVTTPRVRKMTPREWERLQGYPDDFTLVPYRDRMMADGPRYKMLGNSMAVPVLSWLGRRIQMVEEIAHREASQEAA